jgi:hypothetical protein
MWRKMNKTNLFIDIGIFAAFLIADQPALTGVPLHEWFSVAFAATIIVHLLLHWKWIVTVGLRFFQNLFHTSRLKFVVDSLLFVAFNLLMMTGLMISRSFLVFFGIQSVRNQVWTTLHATSASMMLIMTGLHFTLSWNWVVGMGRRYLSWPGLPTFKAQKQPVPVPVEVTRK